MNNRVEDVIDRITSNDSAEAVTDRFISEVQLAINHTFTAYPPEDAFETNETIKELVETLKEKLLDSISSATPNLDDVEHAIVEITSKVFTSIMSKYGLEAPEESAEGAEDFYGDLNARIHAAILFVCFAMVPGPSYYVANLWIFISSSTSSSQPVSRSSSWVSWAWSTFESIP